MPSVWYIWFHAAKIRPFLTYISNMFVSFCALPIRLSSFALSDCVVETSIFLFYGQVLTAIGNFCICSIALGIIIEIIVMYPIQHRQYRSGIDNILVLLIGGIPIAMPTVLSVTMAIGSHRLSQQGAITKRMTAIEEMAGMDVLCSDKTGTLTLNKLTVDKTLVEVIIFALSICYKERKQHL